MDIKLVDCWNDEEFGFKDIPQKLYIINYKDKLEHLNNFLEECFDNFLDPTEIIDQKKLPLGWLFDNVYEYVSLNLNEFDLLSPKAGKINEKELAISIMQLFEAFSDSDLYIDNKEFPQSLDDFIILAKWLIEEEIIVSEVSEEFKYPVFNLKSVELLIENYKLVENLNE